MTRNVKECAVEILRKYLSYDPATGIFRWANSGSPRRPPGDLAGGITRDGYQRIGVAGVRYAAHRIAWAMMTGSWPKLCIDHIDGNRSNNSFVNLREASLSENSHNAKIMNINTTGAKGVTGTKNGKFSMQIGLCGKRYCKSGFGSVDEAAHSYNKKAIELYGDFAVLNPIGVDKSPEQVRKP